MNNIEPGSDVIYSRNLIKRIEELEEERETLSADFELDKDKSDFSKTKLALEMFDEYEGEELKILKAVAEEGEQASDWTYGEILILDSYFEDYARELADELGSMNESDRWPYNHIDWKAAAEELQQDYFSISYGDCTYWIRS